MLFSGYSQLLLSNLYYLYSVCASTTVEYGKVFVFALNANKEFKHISYSLGYIIYFYFFKYANQGIVHSI